MTVQRMTACGGCDKTIVRLDEPAYLKGLPYEWADMDGNVECGEERERHFIKSFSDERLVPKPGYAHNPPPAPESVRSGYANLVRSIERANLQLPENERFHVPFGVQAALAAYVDRYEAIESIKEDT